MTEFTFAIAHTAFRVRAINPYLRVFCRDFLTEEKPEKEIELTPADIARERAAMCERDNDRAGRISDSYLESLALHRKVADYLWDKKVILFHSSALAFDGRAYLFAAKSGTGKSTHTRLWRETFGDRVSMINDDKPMLRLTDEGIFVCGTPWNGKHGLGSNTEVPLAAICILTRDTVNHCELIPIEKALPTLIEQMYRPDTDTALLQAVNNVGELVRRAQLYRLGCTMDPEAARVACEAMTGKTQ